MRCAANILLLLLCSSCGPAVLLCTDEVFRSAAPAVVRAWKGLPPWHDARLSELAAGTGVAAVRAAVKAFPGPSVLVGVALSQSERRNLTAAFPDRRFTFFVPAAEGEATIAVDRVAAWEAVAAAAAAAGTSATVLYPADATPQERGRFATAWRTGGGGALTSWVWPQVGDLGSQTGAVFSWAGAEADPKILGLPPSVPIHGPPGLVRPSGAQGLTWTIRETGLGSFLWAAALGADKKTHFLPLETVPTNR